jgi:uncharacterized protein (TIGR02594 family)
MQKVYAEALKHIGLKEIPGAEHNPKIVQWFADVGHAWVQDDETAYCAAYVGAMLLAVGLPSTKALNARSYMTWGEEVALEDAKRGDIVVLWREAVTSWKGHVAFFNRIDGGKVYLLGANQNNAVNITGYDKSRVLSVRRMVLAPRTSPAQSTTLQAAAVQVATGLGAGGTAIGALDGTAQIVAMVFAGVIVLAALWIMRERLAKWAGGDR